MTCTDAVFALPSVGTTTVYVSDWPFSTIEGLTCECAAAGVANAALHPIVITSTPAALAPE